MLNITDVFFIARHRPPEADLAFVVLTIAYVQNSTISREVFYTLMATAFLKNISVPLVTRFLKHFYESDFEEPASAFAPPPGLLNANWEETRMLERELKDRRGDAPSVN